MVVLVFIKLEFRRGQRDRETLVPESEQEDVHLRSPPPPPPPSLAPAPPPPPPPPAASQRQQQLSGCMLRQFSALRDTGASSQARYRPTAHWACYLLLATPLRIVTLCMFSHSLLTHSSCDRGPINHPPTSPVLAGLVFTLI